MTGKVRLSASSPAELVAVVDVADAIGRLLDDHAATYGADTVLAGLRLASHGYRGRLDHLRAAEAARFARLDTARDASPPKDAA